MDDVGSVLDTARVVVTHAGQNAMVDVACCDVPTVVVPQSRPYAEQHHMADELDRLGLAVAVRHVGSTTPWARVVSAAVERHSRWSMWRTEDDAARAAAVIEGAADG